MLLELFNIVWYGDINPNGVLRNQIKFKSYLNETKTENSKSEVKRNTIKKYYFYFILREKVINPFRDGSFLLSAAKCKAKYEEGIKT